MTKSYFNDRVQWSSGDCFVRPVPSKTHVPPRSLGGTVGKHAGEHRSGPMSQIKTTTTTTTLVNLRARSDEPTIIALVDRFDFGTGFVQISSPRKPRKAHLARVRTNSKMNVRGFVVLGLTPLSKGELSVYGQADLHRFHSPTTNADSCSISYTHNLTKFPDPKHPYQILHFPSPSSSFLPSKAEEFPL